MNHPKTVAVVGGGRLSKQFLPEIIKSNYVIGVDRGAYWLITNGITPNIAIGDFDSVSLKELDEIKKRVHTIKKYPSKKNATDMELAIEYAIKFKPKEVVIYGAIGTRLDHTLVAVQLLEKLLNVGIPGSIHDEYNDIYLVDQITLPKDPHKRYLSLLPVTKQAVVTITGCAYNAADLILHRGKTLGVSNEIREKTATIEVHSGKALVIQSRD